MAPPTGDAAPAKKRRSFFSSRLNITPNLPATTASRAPVVTSSEVLAALSAPEEVVVVKRKPEVKHKEHATHTPASATGTPGTPTPGEIVVLPGQKRALRVKPSPLDEAVIGKTSPPLTPATTGISNNGHAEGSGAGRILRARQSIQYSELEVEENKEDAAPLSPPLTSRAARPKRHSHSGILATSTSSTSLISTPAAAGGSASRVGRHAGKKGGVAHAPLLRTPTMASRRGYKPPPETTISNPSTTGKRGGKNAQHAQSVNERLSQMMLANIRATIGGREEPGPVRGSTVGLSPKAKKTKGTSKITRTTTTIKSRKAQTTMAMTARQKAKLRAEKEKRLRGRSKKYEEEDDVMDDDEDEGFEDMTSSDDDGPARGSGRGKKKHANGRYTRNEKGKGKAKDTGTKAQHDQQVDAGGSTSKSASSAAAATTTSKSKQYMNSGFYCQDANVKSPYKLINKILGTGPKKGGGRKRNAAAGPAGASGLSFPPLPYDHGYEHFFGQEHDFVLPFNIHNAASNGALNDKKKPAPYQKVRGNVFPDRARVTCERVVCGCAPDSGCGEGCINRIMSYLCGRECPSGEGCTNRSLAKRPMAETKVKYDIKEGDFVTDYRGEVISLDTFHDRLADEYAGQRNFYALAYDQDEVIDSGMKGNDARFINHGCDPNLDVRKYQQVGDGLQEYEVGMWALRDIKQGDELFYNYNFDWFAEAKDSLRAECRCGADNCIGVLGRRNGDKTAKDLAAELEAKKAAEAAKTMVKGRKGGIKKVVKKTTRKTVVETKLGAAMKRAKMATSVSAAKQKTSVVEAGTAATADAAAVQGERASSPVVEQVVPARPASPERVATHSNGIDIEGEEEIDELDSDGGMMDFDLQSVEGGWEDAPDELAWDTAGGPSGVKREDGLENGHTSATSLPSPSSRSTEPTGLADPTAWVAAPIAAHIPPAASASGPSTNLFPQQSSGLVLPRNNPFTSTTPEFVPDPSMTPEQAAAAAKAAAAAAKRKSGWTNWLRKIAAEKNRTLEEWHEERIKRRRGIAWMNMMIAEFGVAPSPVPLSADAYSDGRKPAGSVASFANTLAAQGHGPGPQAVKNLGGPKNFYRSDNWGKTREENMKYLGVTPAPDSVRGTPGPSAHVGVSAGAGSGSGSASQGGAGWHGTPGSSAGRLPSVEEGSPSALAGPAKRPRLTDQATSEASKRGRLSYGSPSDPTLPPIRQPSESVSPGPAVVQTARRLSSERAAPIVSSSIASRRFDPVRSALYDNHNAAHHPPAPSDGRIQYQPGPARGQHPGHPAPPLPPSYQAQYAQPRPAPAAQARPVSLGPFWQTAPFPSAIGSRQMVSAGPSAPANPTQRKASSTATAPSSAPRPPRTTPVPIAPALPRASAPTLHPAATESRPPTSGPQPTTDSKPDQSQASLPSYTPTLGPRRETEKKKAIKKRNGAPMGWAYEFLDPTVATSAGEVQEELGRGARRARHSLPAGA